MLKCRLNIACSPNMLVFFSFSAFKDRLLHKPSEVVNITEAINYCPCFELFLTTGVLKYEKGLTEANKFKTLIV